MKKVSVKNQKSNSAQILGCIRLRGAVIGIDGENNCLFTITVDGKVFHLQVTQRFIFHQLTLKI
jgi:hypothetical protein